MLTLQHYTVSTFYLLFIFANKSANQMNQSDEDRDDTSSSDRRSSRGSGTYSIGGEKRREKKVVASEMKASVRPLELSVGLTAAIDTEEAEKKEEHQ